MAANSKRNRAGGSTFFHAASRNWTFVIDIGRDDKGRRIQRTLYARTLAELDRKVRDERLPYDRIATILRICELFRQGHDPRTSAELQRELEYQRFNEQLARNIRPSSALQQMRRRSRRK